MAEDKVEPREVSLSQRLPWLTIFQGFRVALDFNKLLLAAAGIVTMAAGWWLLALIFNLWSEPVWEAKSGNTDEAWNEFRKDHQMWALRYRAAGNPSDKKHYGPGDFAETSAEYQLLRYYEWDEKEGRPKRPDLEGMAKEPNTQTTANEIKAKLADPGFQNKIEQMKVPRPAGELRLWPQSEDRGPNPYLLVTGQTKAWERGYFWDWLLRHQIPVLLEPLVKMIRPIVYFFNPNAGTLNCFYFLLVLFWTVTTWAIFGGAITRIAAVQVARQEKLTLGEAVRFTTKRWLSYVTAPLFPLLFVGFLLVFMVLFGFIHMVPLVGEIWSGLLWWIMLIFGLLMAVGMVGLVGWPLMSSTISTEGTDSWEAVSRSYSYVFQAPWYYAWCGVLALAYGAVVVFFVGFMGSFAIYLSKWGVSQTPWVKTANRDPEYLFVYAPKSFHWRDLMLKGVQLKDGSHVVNPETGRIDEVAYEKYLRNYKFPDGKPYKGDDTLSPMNKLGAILVGFLTWIFFLLILGFSYSYFWSASAIIYLLMRKKVDDAELDEVYLEEDDVEPFRPPAAPATGTVPTPAARPGLSMVEPPALKPPAPTQAPAPAPAPPPPPPPPPAAQTPPPAPPAPEPEPPKPPEPPAEPPNNP